MRATATAVFLLVASLQGCAPLQPEPARKQNDAATKVAPAAVRVVKLDRPDMPQALEPAELATFARGDVLFETMFRNVDGLGPLYIRASCASCHKGDGRGPGTVTRVALSATNAPLRASLLPFGDVVRPYYAPPATDGLEPELAPGSRLTHRLPPAVFGRGHMEAVADSEIERLAADAQTRGGSIKGRIHRVRFSAEGNPDTRYHALAKDQLAIGRFGLKARLATIDEVTSDALLGDMGITSPLRPHEHPNPEDVNDDGKAGMDIEASVLNDIADYVRLLELPARNDLSEEGARLFAAVDCATCHAPKLKTRADYPIARLADTEVAVYTDFLLHDMGDALADDVRDGDASGREWRTAPLIGLRFSPAFLHDGRAKTIEEAVAAHAGAGSEANGSVEKLAALSEAERKTLFELVEKL